MKPSKKSVYDAALANKMIAAQVLLPLVEFEFSFFGVKKPWLAQASQNTEQLKKVYAICNVHGWTCGGIRKLRESESLFKLNNRGFSEIYALAGPMADPKKDQWAKLLTERVEKFRYKEKNIITSEHVLRVIKNARKPMKTLDICLKLRRLPSSMERHLKKLKLAGHIDKNEHGWFHVGCAPGNSPS